ncbi:MAG: prepilin-type N-terminal cleavage/methylation domain-containing protein [Myxococcota bacterium]|nr:prepilin-type N-terminal cleavage/methylation domain-containing protein [Myxococcota bacterium]
MPSLTKPHAELEKPATVQRQGAAGFTLVELMVVVTILAVLSIVAITSYKYYMRRAYGQEARGLLLDMKMKQEQYFATWSQYVSWTGTTVDPSTAWPTTSQLDPKDNTLYKWNSLDCSSVTAGSLQEALCHLSFRPAGNESHWRVATWGWTPGFSGSVTGSDSFFNSVVAPLDLTQRWYVAIAVRDADGDGKLAKFAVHSQATAIWSENETE